MTPIDNHSPLRRLAAVHVIQADVEEEGPPRYIEVIVSEVSPWWIGQEGLHARLDKEKEHFIMFIPYNKDQYYLSRFERPFEHLQLETAVRCALMDTNHHLGLIEIDDADNFIEQATETLHQMFTSKNNTIRTESLPYHLITLKLREYHPPH